MIMSRRGVQLPDRFSIVVPLGSSAGMTASWPGRKLFGDCDDEESFRLFISKHCCGIERDHDIGNFPLSTTAAELVASGIFGEWHIEAATAAVTKLLEQVNDSVAYRKKYGGQFVR